MLAQHRIAAPAMARVERRALLCRCSADQYPQPRELPGGAFWLSKEATNHDVVYGQDFVLQRPRFGGPGLVLSQRPSSITNFDAHRPSKLAAPRRSFCGPPAVKGSMWDVTDVTDYTVLGEAGLLPSSKTPFLLPGGAMTVTPPPNTSCTGIILHPAIERQPEEEAGPDKNPRRTKKVKFTCKLCETVSVKRVSPHGWRSGSVFARCDGCGVVHKLVDNLKIFHEFKGAVFPAARAPTDLKIPEGLPQKPGLTYHVHPAVYPHLPSEDRE